MAGHTEFSIMTSLNARAALLAAGLTAAVAVGGARADDMPKPDLFDSGKLLATGGVTQVEGRGAADRCRRPLS